jgi:hypothetical protein
MSLATVGDPTNLEAFIGSGAFTHSFNGWIDWSADMGCWDFTELNKMFLAEAPYQTPVLQTIYKMVLIDVAYRIEYSGGSGPLLDEDGWRIVNDPFTGNQLSTGDLAFEAAVEAGLLVLSYKITPAASGGSYADDLLSVEMKLSASPSSDAQRRLLEVLNVRSRQLELGTDAARGFIPHEGIGGYRLEQAIGRRLTRPDDVAIDFIDNGPLGKISLNGPIPARGDLDGLAASAIDDANFNSATKTLVIDTLGLTSDQITVLKAAVEAGTQGTTKAIIYLQ